MAKSTGTSVCKMESVANVERKWSPTHDLGLTARQVGAGHARDARVRAWLTSGQCRPWEARVPGPLPPPWERGGCWKHLGE